MEKEKRSQHLFPTGDMSLAVAVGVSKVKDCVAEPEPKRWFIAIVMNNTEMSCCKKLNDMFSADGPKASDTETVCAQTDNVRPSVDGIIASDFETYVPYQKELRIWRNGRRKKVDRILIPTYVFIYCTESVRKTIKSASPFIIRFMKNRAGQPDEFGVCPFAFIPDHQMQSLQRMVGDAETPVTIDPRRLHVGTKVRVKGGKLDGFEGCVLREPNGKTSVVIYLDFLGSAKVEVPLEQLEMV